MTTEAIAPSAAPINSALSNSRLSDTCVIWVNRNSQSTRVRTDDGWEWLTSHFWTSSLSDAADDENTDFGDALYSRDQSIGARNELIQDLKAQARCLGYIRCQVFGDEGETISDGALRAIRLKSVA